MYVEFCNRRDGVSAIEEGLEALAGAGVVCGDEVVMGSIEERVKVDHVTGHVVGPFEHLWPNVDQECIGGPSSEDHYFCWRVVN
jgi:hypothetical protein